MNNDLGVPTLQSALTLFTSRLLATRLSWRSLQNVCFDVWQSRFGMIMMTECLRRYCWLYFRVHFLWPTRLLTLSCLLLQENVYRRFELADYLRYGLLKLCYLSNNPTRNVCHRLWQYLYRVFLSAYCYKSYTLMNCLAYEQCCCWMHQNNDDNSRLMRPRGPIKPMNAHRWNTIAIVFATLPSVLILCRLSVSFIGYFLDLVFLFSYLCSVCGFTISIQPHILYLFYQKDIF